MLLSKLALLAACVTSPFIVEAKRSLFRPLDSVPLPSVTCAGLPSVLNSTLNFAVTCDNDRSSAYDIQISTRGGPFSYRSSFVNDDKKMYYYFGLDMLSLVEFSDSTPEAYSKYQYTLDQASGRWSMIDVRNLVGSDGVGYKVFTMTYTHKENFKVVVDGTYSEGYTTINGQKFIPAAIKYNVRILGYSARLPNGKLVINHKLASSEEMTLDATSNKMWIGKDSMSLEMAGSMLVDGIDTPITLLYKPGKNSVMGVEMKMNDEADIVKVVLETIGEEIVWDPLLLPPSGTKTVTATSTAMSTTTTELIVPT